MVRLIKYLLLSFVLLTSSVQAAQQVEIISRFSPATASGRFAMEAVEMLNNMQKEYKFKYTNLIGANGEAADQRAIALARNGQKVLLWNSTSTYTFNRYIVGNTYDRDNDLIPLYGIAGVSFSIMVHPESNINTYDDFIKFVKSKPIVYMGNTASSSTVNMLKAILVKHENLNNIKDLSYEKPNDMVRALLTNEIDFTIFNPADVIGFKQLVSSNYSRTRNNIDVPIGHEVGMNDFKFMTQTLVSVPKEQKEFGEKLRPLLAKICYDESFGDLVMKSNYVSSCMGTNRINERIQEELQLIEQYKDSLDLKVGPK